MSRFDPSVQDVTERIDVTQRSSAGSAAVGDGAVWAVFGNSVIGKIDPVRAKALVERYFGGWKAEGPKPDIDLPRVPRNPPSMTVVPDRSRIQDQVLLAQTVGIDRFDPDYYPLQLGNHVLGGGFYATRLYRDLREHAGLVYSVGVNLEASRTRAIYLIGYACDP